MAFSEHGGGDSIEASGYWYCILFFIKRGNMFIFIWMVLKKIREKRNVESQ